MRKLLTTKSIWAWVMIILSFGHIHSQESNINQTMTDDKGNTHLIGVTTASALTQEPFSEWYNEYYEEYEANKKVLETLQDKEYSDLSILAFMGTWCGDSKREIPRFFKVADQVGIQEEQITLINVYRDLERYKMSPGGEEKGLNIHRVPTFIFIKRGRKLDESLNHRSPIWKRILPRSSLVFQPNPGIMLYHISTNY